jgi:hypothetical protein
MTDQPITETIALPARWECGHGVSDDEPFCAEAEDDGHVCPTIRVHPDDAVQFAALVDEAHRQQTELRRDRDLAIAHDRQPYPTAWAYEQACKALHRKEAAVERVLEFAASLDETGRQLAGPDAVHPVAAHIRHLLAQPTEPAAVLAAGGAGE